MALDQQSSMTDSEIDAFLARHETGVLSLARGDEPYAIPVSYGYDSAEQLFFVRLVSGADSEKRQFLTADPAVRFVVYEERETTYRSVIARGRLESVPTDELDVDRIEQFGDAQRPLFEVWGTAKADLEIDLYELDPAELTGRQVDLDEPISES
jgi:nitroimidazol reductase NimA-like FMN-containing flavoprotein (pyridoxamine 5'-phosphate oxidase superfamily)